MEIKHYIAQAVTEKSQAAEARRHAASLAGILNLSRKDASNVAIIVTELAMNLAKHTTGGELLLHQLRHKTAVGVEVIALDKGPGMANIGQCLSDGYSSTGSPGTGLGAVQRLSTLFDVLSVPQLGTVVLVRYWSDPKVERSSTGGFHVGAVSIPKPGESFSGDSWTIELTGNRAKFLLVDGLGHGQLAADASNAAIRAFHKISQDGSANVLTAINKALHGTRGAAVAVTEIEQLAGILRFAGIGNISSCIWTRDGIKKMVSLHGIVGADVRKIQEFSHPWPNQAILLMHSDGLHNRYVFEKYPGIMNRHPGIIAGVFYRDNNRGSDDSTVLVARAKTGT